MHIYMYIFISLLSYNIYYMYIWREGGRGEERVRWERAAEGGGEGRRESVCERDREREIIAAVCMCVCVCVQGFPRLARMTRQYLAVPATFASPERPFSSVGLVNKLVKSDLWGNLWTPS
jgi:hypothetical protein